MKFLCQLLQKLQPERTDRQTDTTKTLPLPHTREVIKRNLLLQVQCEYQHIVFLTLLQVPEIIPPGKGGGGVGWKVTHHGRGLEVDVAPGGGNMRCHMRFDLFSTTLSLCISLRCTSHKLLPVQATTSFLCLTILAPVQLVQLSEFKVAIYVCSVS